ncbi:MAG TPA: hypothetical protein VKE27_07775 [Candidatus Dormibacteraeota bacterium]|nr:hypothetical protein [Candidatus Dormibacteraeota bacterium]
MRGAVVAAICATFALTSCGGSNSSSNSNPASSPSPSAAASTVASVDACKLITAEDASTAVGAAVINLAAIGNAAIPGACYYTTQDEANLVLIFAQTYPDAATADQVSPTQLTSVLQGQYGITNAKSVTGIGDKAVEYTTSASASQTANSGEAIFVFKSNVVLFIILSPSTDSAKIEALARTAVSRL